MATRDPNGHAAGAVGGGPNGGPNENAGRSPDGGPNENAGRSPDGGPNENMDGVGPAATPDADLLRLRVRFEAHVLDQGLRFSPQRRAVLDAFFEAGGHLTLEDVLERVRRRHDTAGYSTVYRTLRLLVEAGIAQEQHFNRQTRYELVHEDAHHDHLVCERCGAIDEFEEPRIEAMQRALAARHGFTLLSHRHELYGLCAACLGLDGA